MCRSKSDKPTSILWKSKRIRPGSADVFDSLHDKPSGSAGKDVNIFSVKVNPVSKLNGCGHCAVSACGSQNNVLGGSRIICINTDGFRAVFTKIFVSTQRNKRFCTNKVATV